MRLHSAMSQDQIRAALGEAARQSWGPERLDALQGALDRAAQCLWMVLQTPLAPLGEEMDLPSPPRPLGREG